MLHKSVITTTASIEPSSSREVGVTRHKPRKRAEPQNSSPILSSVRKRSIGADETKKVSPKNKRKSSACESSTNTTKKRSWREGGRKLSEALPAALRINPGNILRRSSASPKKPLGPSLSWDPEHRSRSPSASSRSRVHSDGSNDPSNAESPTGFNNEPGINEPRFELEITCPHCLLVAEYRKSLLKSQLENAVIRLARRLGSQQAQFRDDGLKGSVANNGPFGTPDIVVSSISSDDEDHTSTDRYNTGSEKGSSLQTSEASSAGSASTCPSPSACRNANDTFFDSPTNSQDAGPSSPLQLMPQRALLSPYPPDGASSSPPRSNSIDISILRKDIELLSVSSGESGSGSDEFEPPSLADSVRTNRSRSHDPAATSVLRRPSRIEHLSEIFRKALAKSPVVRRTAVEQEIRTVNKHRTSRYWLDDHVSPSEHIWVPLTGQGSSASADTECYVGEKDCRKSGEKRRCAACHVVAHTSCFPLLSRLNLNCKTTFRDHTARKQAAREMIDSLTMHHWVHKWKLEGRCTSCGKSFQQKMFFQGKEKKETIAVTCSWCKESYHLKGCFNKEKLEDKCDRGVLREMIVPASWILRLPNRKRSKRKENINRSSSRKPMRQFIVKPNDLWSSGPSQPLIVFVNPKSGGNKGAKALHTLCWLLNPRQVFDITSLKGPKYGLDVYRKVVTHLRILVCGGDGTVGWVLQTLDNLNWPTYPPMAIMPLGTGNDLARCMGWGGNFSDEPLSQLLHAILHETTVTHLDRWKIQVEPNEAVSGQAEHANGGDELGSPSAIGTESSVQSSSLPLNVFSNYFSVGADAQIALQFHHSRSANPQMLNSRLKNRIAYGGLGTIDLFKRRWKDLSDYITLECDDVDITPRIKELKLHCILCHNITYYSGGTIPWGQDSGNTELKPSFCDGKIEVLGFTTASLAALQMGGRGERLAQCSKVRVVTNKAIPMQVDGEPCLLAPSTILLTFHSKVPMLKRDKKIPCTPNLMRRNNHADGKDFTLPSCSLIQLLPVIVVGRCDYETYKDDVERLKDTAYEIGTINIEAEAELNIARVVIEKMLADHRNLPYETEGNWRFLDYISNAEEGTFRVSRHQESVHSVSDVCNPDECLLILDDAFPSMTGRDASEFEVPVIEPVGCSNSTPPPVVHNRRSSRRISETLRIVLSSDVQETHL